MANLNRLNSSQIKTLTKPGKYSDGGNLYLEVKGPTNRYWSFKFMVDGRSREMSLGSENDIGLAVARTLAGKAREMLAQGIDPLAERQAAQAAKRAAAEAVRVEVDAKTFSQAMEAFLVARQAEWTNPKHAAQWRSTLTAYAVTAIGHKRVDSLTIEDAQAVLDPLWHTKTETASRVRGKVEAVLDFAKVMGWRSGENPFAWRGNLSHLFPSKAKVAPTEHHAALPWRDLPSAMSKLAESAGTSALTLRFGVLTASRFKEFSGALWAEIDLKTKTWLIPAARMKARKAHRIPLSDEALAILEAAQTLKSADNNLVFPGGGKKGKQLSDVAISKALSQVAQGYTVHGMRSCFRDWCAEATTHPREMAEAALAHSNGSATEAAYFRSDLFEKRRELMQNWAAYACSQMGS